jgi:xanthosine utilization system XapX-like protein
MIRASAQLTITTATALLALSIASVGVPAAAEIKVLSGSGVQPVMNELVPQFEQASGHKVTFDCGTVGGMAQRVRVGEVADVNHRVRTAGRHAEAACSAVKQGREAVVTVFARDPAANANRGPTAATTLPVIRVEQDGRVVFDSGILLVTWLLTPVMFALALIGLLGITVNWRKSPIVIHLSRSPVVLAFDRVARRVAQMLPTRRGLATTRARFAMAFLVFWLLCAVAVATYLVITSHW